MKDTISKLKDKYDKLSVQVKATLWFTISGFLQRGASIISTPIFTRIMTTTEYGQFSVYNAWNNVLIIFGTLYLYNGVINNCFVKIEKNRDYTIAALQGLSTVSALLFFLLCYIIRPILFPAIGLPHTVIYFMLFSFIFAPSIYYWSISERFDYHYKKPVIANIISAFTSVIISLICVLLSTNKGEARILSYIAVLVIIGIFFYIRNIYFGKCFYDKEIWKFALAFNLPLIPHFLSEVVLNQSDKIMINMFDSTSNAGIYGVAYSIASLVTIFITALNASLVPWQYKALKNKKYKDMNRVSFIVLSAVTLVLFALMLFAPEAIYILASSKYSDSINLVPPLAVGLFFNFLQQLFIRVELYYEKKSYTVYSSISAAILNIILNYIFMKMFGYQAVAYVTAFCYIVVCVFHYFCYLKICRSYTDVECIYDPKMLLLISGIMIVIGIVSLLLYPYTIVRYIIICVIAGVAFINKNKLITAFKSLKK